MAEWIIQLIERFSYGGIALLMALENVFPPIPSELIMPFAGFVAARGDLSPVGVVLAGAAGSLAGTLPWYWLGRKIGRERLGHWVERHGRWFTMSTQDLERAEQWLERHGGAAVLFGRLVPAVRSVISMPAGVTRMPMASFLLWSSAGTLVWTSALAALGFALESQYERIAEYLDIVTKVVLGAIVLAYVWRVLRFGKKKEERPAAQ
jgi:membrane protein DedA with SNARE-associated domain